MLLLCPKWWLNYCQVWQAKERTSMPSSWEEEYLQVQSLIALWGSVYTKGKDRWSLWAGLSGTGNAHYCYKQDKDWRSTRQKQQNLILKEWKTKKTRAAKPNIMLSQIRSDHLGKERKKEMFQHRNIKCQGAVSRRVETEHSKIIEVSAVPG